VPSIYAFAVVDISIDLLTIDRCGKAGRRCPEINKLVVQLNLCESSKIRPSVLAM
jgi:hypothetical protein